MLRIHNLKIPYRSSNTASDVMKVAAKKLSLRPEELMQFQIVRRSLDTRKKPDLYEIYTVDLSCNKEDRILKSSKGNDVTKVQEEPYSFCITGTKALEHPPVIIGAGPAGLFCALELARAGYRPILIERGKPVEERQKDVEKFWSTGDLKEDSNVQFGEGGAGTFSDGKLNTLVKDHKGRNHQVLSEFVRFGAKDEIKIEAKPHIGTDVLVGILKKMRQEILDYGGSIHFETKLTEIIIKSGRISGIRLTDNTEIPCQVLVLAIGNSARDTFIHLSKTDLVLQAKPFAVGFRVEHPQELINEALYGKGYDSSLPAANYKVTAKSRNQKGVYSFCMCPGGYVVNASSEEGMLAVNGMSYSKRDGQNANSAIVVSVDESDFGSSDVLAGLEYQRNIERAAYISGNGNVPQQLWGDFLKNRASSSFGSYTSSLKGQGSFANLRNIYSSKINEALMEGMAHFQKIMPGFDADDVILSGVESRTSSPVKIPRNDLFESNIAGIYPCGEGAGYAGGIVSAGMDGLKVAQAIAAVYCP